MNGDVANMTKNILIVDDEESIVTLLTYHLEKEGFTTDKAHTGKEALEKVATDKFDLAVLDIMIPDIDGMEICSQLRNEKNDIPIIMLTAKDDQSDKIHGLDIGADDYLTKPFSPKEVISRIKAVFRRIDLSHRDSFQSLKIGELILYPERYTAVRNDRELTFTRKEFELLHYLVEQRGKVLSREELLQTIWNYSFMGDTRIVDVHISRLREKIECDMKHPEYIKTVRGLGYKIEEPT